MISNDRHVGSKAELLKQVLTGVNKRIYSVVDGETHIIVHFSGIFFAGATDREWPSAAPCDGVKCAQGDYCASLLCLSALTLMMKFLAE